MRRMRLVFGHREVIVKLLYIRSLGHWVGHMCSIIIPFVLDSERSCDKNPQAGRSSAVGDRVPLATTWGIPHPTSELSIRVSENLREA